MYSHFNCNNDTSGQVSFGPAGGKYPVTIIHPKEQTFTIRVNNYTAIDVVRKLQELNHLPFNVTKSNLSSKDGWLNEVEIRWKPPLSPICNSVKDCDDWPHSTCHTMKGGTKRCLCNRVPMGSLKFQLHSRLESYINAQYDNSVPCTFNFAL